MSMDMSDKSKWEETELGDHGFARYLRDMSGNNNWYWKSNKDCNLFFSEKGKLIAVVQYYGQRKMSTRRFILKEK
jgi:hypothetical protein